MLSASLALDLSINGVPSEAAPGPEVGLGAPVTRAYVVSNVGDEPIYGLRLDDDWGTAFDSADDGQPAARVQIASEPQTPVGTIEARFSDSRPTTFLVDPFRPYLYISTYSPGGISVINTETLQLEYRIEGGDGADVLAMSPDGKRLLSLRGSSQFNVIDLEARRRITSVQLAGENQGLTVDGTGAVYLNSSNGVHQVSPETGQVIRSTEFTACDYGRLLADTLSDMLVVSSSGCMQGIGLQTTPPTNAWKVLTKGYGAILAGDAFTIESDSTNSKYQLVRRDLNTGVVEATTIIPAPANALVPSPGLEVIYVILDDQHVEAFDARTLTSLGIVTNHVGERDSRGVAAVDVSGRHLFIKESGVVVAYSTGRARAHNVGDLNGNWVLDVGESWEFFAEGVARGGAHEYTITASGIGTESGERTQVRETAHYLGVGAAIGLRWSINGATGDPLSTLSIAQGKLIAWVYTVANDGGLPLDQVELVNDGGTPDDDTDDFRPRYLAGDDDQNGLLDLNEEWLFGFAELASAGPHQHRARVSAVVVGENPSAVGGQNVVTDEVVAAYFGSDYRVQVAVFIQGEPAGVGPGPRVPAFTPVQRQYRVTNPGNAPLWSVYIRDDRGTEDWQDDLAITSHTGDLNRDGWLGTDEEWVFEVNTVAMVGANDSTVTVQADTSIDRRSSVSATAECHFFTTRADLKVEARVAGQVWNGAPGPITYVGEELTTDYLVSNPGSLPLEKVVLSEDNGTPGDSSDDWFPQFLGGDRNVNGLLDPGEVWRYSYTDTARRGQYQGSVLARGRVVDDQAAPGGASEIVQATAKTFHRGAAASVDVVAEANGKDAGSSPGPSIPIDSPVEVRFHIRNTGTDPLTIQRVSDVSYPGDEDPVTPEYASGDQNGNGRLDLNETWVYREARIARPFLHRHEIVVLAIDPFGREVESASAAFYDGTGASISLQTGVLGRDVGPPRHADVVGNAPVTFSFSVTNRGDVDLGYVTVVSDHCTPTSADDATAWLLGGDIHGDGVLGLGETWVLTTVLRAELGEATCSATATARPVGSSGQALPNSEPVVATEVFRYFGWKVDVTTGVMVNGQPATGPAVVVENGQPLEWRVEVTNSGNAALTGLTVVGDSSSNPTGVGRQLPLPPVPMEVPISASPMVAFERLAISQLLRDPRRPYVYASVPTINSIVVINTNTLELERLLDVASFPRGMALTPDGNQLVVANSGARELSVIDLETWRAKASIPLPLIPQDVKVGADGGIWVLGLSELDRVDPGSGKLKQIDRWIGTRSGKLAINKTGDRLYHAMFEWPHASVTQYDISSDPPQRLAEIGPYTDQLAGTGRDLVLSENGEVVSLVMSGLSQIPTFDTAGMSPIAPFDVGALPRAIAYSPNGREAYAADASGKVQVWSDGELQPLWSFEVSGQVSQLLVDHEKHLLLVVTDSGLLVFSTKPSVRDLNAGDLNGSGILEPGETWYFTAKDNWTAGEHQTRFTVAGEVAHGYPEGVFTRTTAGHYLGIESVAVRENIAGVVLAGMPSTSLSPVVTDSRFEVKDGTVRLKENQYLRFPQDDGLEVRVLSNDPEPMVARSFVLSIVPNACPWRNALEARDVNADGMVTPLDVLLVINALNSGTAGILGVRPESLTRYYDVDGDGELSPVDAISVINWLNQAGGVGEARVPEESGKRQVDDRFEDVDWLAGLVRWEEDDGP